MADEQVVATALGESAHDKAMIQKVEGAAPAAPSVPTKPDHIPEKFWDSAKGEVRLEELAKSYVELEKGRTAPTKPAEAPPADPTSVAKAAEDAAKAAGADTSNVDFKALSAEFAQKGELSPEAYAKLESAGVTKDLVDQFIAGQQALQSTALSSALEVAGGAQVYQAMSDWAVVNLPKAEQEAYNKAVTGDAATRNMAITALKVRYEAAVGNTPKLVTGSNGSAMAGSYQSRAEVTADMRNPKYKADPAFRAQVEAKLANSSVF